MARRVKLDMTGVESFTRCPEGRWVAKLTKAEMGEVQGSGDDAIKARFEVIKGEAKGCTVFETFSLTEKALWKLKMFLDAIGMKSSGRISLDLDKIEGKVCTIEVNHDEYNGQKRARISSYMMLGDSNEDDDDDEDIEDIDDEEDEDEEEEKPKKKPAKKTAKKVKTPEPEEDDDDEDDEEEEEVKPKKKQAKKTSKPAKKTRKPEPEDDEDDDEDDWEEDDE